MDTAPDISVLIVEDNPGDVRLIREMLKEGWHTGLEIGVGEKLETAVSLIQEKNYDAIILDLNLPDSSGLQTLERILTVTGNMIPVIIYTGMSDESLGESSIGRGAEDYLIKGAVDPVMLARSLRYGIGRKRIEAELRESREIFDEFMEHSPIYVFFKDDKIRSLRLSRNFEEMLGKPIDELLGKTMDELFPSELSKTMIEDDLRIMKGGTPLKVEEELHGRFYYTIKFPIYQLGKPKFLAGYTIDITERKMIEETLRRQVEELQRWQAVIMGREGRVMELKKEVNGLLRELGREIKYGE